MTIASFSSQLGRVESAARRLSAADITARGRFLGAGMGGGAYEVQLDGVDYVAKQWGHPQSIMGGFSDNTSREYRLFAAKQTAVQNALAMAGFPVPASAILGQDPTWVLMDKVSGTAAADLPETEQKQALAQADAMAGQMEPIIVDTLEHLRRQHPEQEKFFEYMPDMQGNMRFAHGPGGLYISGSFDPVM